MTRHSIVRSPDLRAGCDREDEKGDGRDDGRHGKALRQQSGDVVEEVVLGVDTHLDVHVAVALDGLGRRLGELTVPTTEKGYRTSSPGRKASAPWEAPVWRGPAATAPGSPAT